MSPFKFDDFNERRDAAAKAKQAMLEKFRAKQRPAEATGAPAADAPEAAAPQPDSGGEAGGKESGKPGKARK
jgi:Family of unknown function (DUF6481)